MPRDFDLPYPALILKASGHALHHGTLAVVRTLGRLGVPVYAVVADGYTPVGASRYLTKAFMWKSWPRDRSSFLDAMSAIGEFVGRPLVLFPMDDLSAIYSAENAADLARWFVLPAVQPGLPRRLADKIRLHDLCSEIGMPVARVVVPHSIDDIFAFADGSRFPVVVKAAEQWALLDDRFSTKVVSSPSELIGIYKRLGNVENPRSILQEYIEGEDWISHGYCNSEKGIHLIFTGRKLLGYPAAAGSTALGLSVPNEILCRQTESLLKAVAYSGIVDIDWRRDKRDGQYKILDCNPRIGQNFRMFENSAGIDVVRAQYLDLIGRQIDSAPMIAGRLFSVESFCFLALLRGSYRRTSMPDVGAYTPVGCRELAWWNRDDPLPFFVMSARMPISLLQRACRHAGRLFSVWGKSSGRPPKN